MAPQLRRHRKQPERFVPVMTQQYQSVIIRRHHQDILALAAIWIRDEELQSDDKNVRGQKAFCRHACEKLGLHPGMAHSLAAYVQQWNILPLTCLMHAHGAHHENYARQCRARHPEQPSVLHHLHGSVSVTDISKLALGDLGETIVVSLMQSMGVRARARLSTVGADVVGEFHGVCMEFDVKTARRSRSSRHRHYDGQPIYSFGPGRSTRQHAEVLYFVLLGIADDGHIAGALPVARLSSDLTDERASVLLRTLREIPVYVMPRGTQRLLYTASCFDGLGIRPLRLFCDALLAETPMKLRTLAGNASWSSLVVGQIGQKPSERLTNNDIGAWGERTVQSLAERCSLEWSLRHPLLPYLFLDRYGWDLRIRVREQWMYAQVKESCADDHVIARIAERTFDFLVAQWEKTLCCGCVAGLIIVITCRGGFIYKVHDPHMPETVTHNGVTYSRGRQFDGNAFAFPLNPAAFLAAMTQMACDLNGD